MELPKLGWTLTNEEKDKLIVDSKFLHVSPHYFYLIDVTIYLYENFSTQNLEIQFKYLTPDLQKNGVCCKI